MQDRALQLVLDPRAAEHKLFPRHLLALPGEVAMADGVRADRNQRIAGKRFQFVPGHAEVAADRRLVDAMARHNAAISHCRSCSCRVRIQSCRRSKAACLAEALEASRRTGSPPIIASTEDAFAITCSSASHHSRPVPSAKSLVTKTVKGAAYSRP